MKRWSKPTWEENGLLPLTVYNPVSGEAKAGTRQELWNKAHRERLFIAFCFYIVQAHLCRNSTAHRLGLPNKWIKKTKNPAPTDISTDQCDGGNSSTEGLFARCWQPKLIITSDYFLSLPRTKHLRNRWTCVLKLLPCIHIDIYAYIHTCSSIPTHPCPRTHWRQPHMYRLLACKKKVDTLSLKWGCSLTTHHRNSP